MGLIVGGTPDAVASAATDEFRAPNSTATVRYGLIVPRQTFKLYDDQFAGNQITALRNTAGTAIGSVITADDYGQMPFVQLPEGLRVNGVWCDPDDNSASRFWLPVRFGPVDADALIATVPGYIPVYALANANTARPTTARVEWIVNATTFPTPDFTPNNIQSGDKITPVRVTLVEPPLPSTGVVNQWRYRLDNETGPFADGDPFGQFTDQTANANHCLAVSSAVRGLVRLPSGNRLSRAIEFNSGSVQTRYNRTFGTSLTGPGWLWAMVKVTTPGTATQAIYGPDWGLQQVGNTSSQPAWGAKRSSVPKSVALATSSWTHLFAVFTSAGASSKFYVNGVLDSTINPGSVSLASLIIGGTATTGAAGQFKGLLGDSGGGVVDTNDNLPTGGYIAALANWCASRWKD